MRGADRGGFLKSGALRAAVLAACVITAGVIIALMRGPLPSNSSKDVQFAGASGAAGAVVVIVFIALILLTILELIRLIRRGPQRRGKMTGGDSKRSILETVIAIVVVLVVLFLLLQFGHPVLSKPNTRLGSQNSTAGNLGLPATNSSFAGALFGGLAFALLVPMVGIVAVIVIFALMSLFGSREEIRKGTGVKAAVAEAVEHSIEEIAGGKDPREAVIEVYSEMRWKLVQEGALDGTSTTPREFGRGAVERLGLRHQTVHQLTLLYEEAKFSLHPMSAVEEKRAMTLLKQIVEELRNGV